MNRVNHLSCWITERPHAVWCPKRKTPQSSCLPHTSFRNVRLLHDWQLTQPVQATGFHLCDASVRKVSQRENLLVPSSFVSVSFWWEISATPSFESNLVPVSSKAWSWLTQRGGINTHMALGLRVCAVWHNTESHWRLVILGSSCLRESAIAPV